MSYGTKNTTTPGCGFHHISIQTQTYDESMHLYRDILGMQVRLETNLGARRLALLDMGDGSYVELQWNPEKDGPLAPGNPLAHFALATHDVRGVIEKLRAAGYPITMEPKDVQLGTLPASVAFFTGPSGESVELFQEN
jgi:catechol 2,3-dioxygenase-like lactoylglutathione lyase family enzyme